MDVKAIQNLLTADTPEEFHKKTLEVLRLKVDKTILFIVDNNQLKITGYKLFNNTDELNGYIVHLQMSIGYVCFYKTNSVFELAASFYTQGWAYHFDGTNLYSTNYYDNNHNSLDEFKSLEYDQIFDCNKPPKAAA